MRQLIGNFLFVVGQFISTILFTPFALLLVPFLNSLQKAQVVGYWARYIRWSLKVFCGIDHRVQGQENLPSTPSVILSNHQSAWETILFQTIFPAHSYLLKKELLWLPFFGWSLATNEPIAINRGKKTQALQQLITQGKQRLADGRWIAIFPEGTRMPVGQPGEFQAGGAYIAVKANVPVIPVAHNAGVFWNKKHPFRKNPGTIDVVIGPAIQTSGRKPRDVNKEAKDWILTAMDTLAKQV